MMEDEKVKTEKFLRHASESEEGIRKILSVLIYPTTSGAYEFLKRVIEKRKGKGGLRDV